MSLFAFSKARVKVIVAVLNKSEIPAPEVTPLVEALPSSTAGGLVEGCCLRLREALKKGSDHRASISSEEQLRSLLGRFDAALFAKTSIGAELSSGKDPQTSADRAAPGLAPGPDCSGMNNATSRDSSTEHAPNRKGGPGMMAL
ncbi:hypothetical protein EYF80_031736 [Liparis tanakae]|uniref:Uncharacterized protein n=1 Tax=Liparis tanakae TaxID=230148 RepID=A0A4Z2GZP5_9TELE|nr:hypothetical protein EYF80_031736 [Liparis tanakae]